MRLNQRPSEDTSRVPCPALAARGGQPHRVFHPISFPPVIPLSQTAAQILFWCAAIVALFAQAMVLRAALAGRTPAASQATSARAREVLWIVLPACALAVVLWFTWRALPRRVSPFKRLLIWWIGCPSQPMPW